MNGQAESGKVARAALIAVTAAALVTGAAGCSGGAPGESRQPTAKLARTGNGKVESVVLTPLGASRIAVRTAPVTAAAAGIAVPYPALLYEPDGDAAVYVNTGRLTYTRYVVPVAEISGGTVYLKPGSLPAGAQVVTQGAEELLGVQNGVGEET